MGTDAPEIQASPTPEQTERYLELKRKVASYLHDYDEAALDAAYDFAADAHEGQLRKDGSPFVTHPVEVAYIVAEWSLDLDSIIAALLHDTIEDTGHTYPEIKEKFGTSVANLVDGVTKLTRVPYTSKVDQQMENLRKMVMAMARDIRVLLIKIADRLHNMRTLEYQSEQKRREKSLETMEIYAPLAHRLGMQKIKWELEDRSLYYLNPEAFRELTAEVEARNEIHGQFLDTVKQRLGARLEEAGIQATIEGRIKHIYSIYRKMYDQHKALFEIYDLYAVRVIVDTIADCYNVLGFVHDLFKPIPGRFKDYISTPKPNLYQSLHTTVIGREGLPFEVQIRTKEMHQTAEYGIAAHWKYKEGISGRVATEEKLEWVRRLLETQQDTDAEDFIHNLKIDMFADEVFVFTPNGDVINLPTGATPIDFAYAIHSAVGNRMSGVKVNGRMVNLEYQLQNGDIIEVLTSSNHGPSRDWFRLAKTSEARNKIKQWFKKERREENVQQGQIDFDRELSRSGIPMSTVTGEDVLPNILKRLSFASLEDLYAAIGYGGISAQRAINRIRDELVRINRLMSDKTVVERNLKELKKPKKPAEGVIVEGISGCLIKFARCCAPVPGDPIEGFVTRGYGVSVHRADCENVIHGKENNDDPSRWVRVRWAENLTEVHLAALAVTANDREGLLADVTGLLKNIKVTVRQINGRSMPDDIAVVHLVCDVHDITQLNEVIHKLERISGVKSVERGAIQ